MQRIRPKHYSRILREEPHLYTGVSPGESEDTEVDATADAGDATGPELNEAAADSPECAVVDGPAWEVIPIMVCKETYHHIKRALSQYQKRPLIALLGR